MLTEDNDGGSAADSPFVVVDAVFTVTPRDWASKVNISPLLLRQFSKSSMGQCNERSLYLGYADALPILINGFAAQVKTSPSIYPPYLLRFCSRTRSARVAQQYTPFLHAMLFQLPFSIFISPSLMVATHHYKPAKTSRDPSVSPQFKIGDIVQFAQTDNTTNQSDLAHCHLKR